MAGPKIVFINYKKFGPLLDENNCVNVFVPPNLTHMFQPLDLSINGVTKSHPRPRLKGAVSLHRMGMGLHGNLGSDNDVKGAGDPKSEERNSLTFERDRHIFKKARKN